MAVDRLARIQKIFSFMDSNSKMVHARERFGPDSPEGYVRIWSGYTSHIAGLLDMPSHAVYESLTALINLGCIRLAIKGTGRQLSIYVIEQEPTQELWDHYAEFNTISGRFEVPTKYERVMETINLMRKKMASLEERILQLETKEGNRVP
jgi:hypothetical protein